MKVEFEVLNWVEDQKGKNQIYKKFENWAWSFDFKVDVWSKGLKEVWILKLKSKIKVEYWIESLSWILNLKIDF